MTEKLIDNYKFTASSAGKEIDAETQEKISRFQARHFGRIAREAMRY